MESRNNIGCDIARDLMPLVIDGIASDAAKAAVEAHTARCAECGRIMEVMREESELARQPALSEARDTRFIQFCRRMEKRFTLRRAILALLALLLAIAVIVGGFAYVNYQVNNASAYMKFAPEEAGDTFQLVQNQFGVVSLKLQVDDTAHPYFGCEGHSEFVGSKLVYYISPKTCAWPHGLGGDGMTGTIYNDLFEIRVEDGRLVIPEYINYQEFDETGSIVTKRRMNKPTPISRLWLGFGDAAILIYREGDPVDFPVERDELPGA